MFIRIILAWGGENRAKMIPDGENGMEMNGELVKQEVITFAKGIGIDKIGFTTAEPFYSLKERLEEHQAKGYASGFEEMDIDKRVYPKLTLPDAKSIIAVALAHPSRFSNPNPSEPGAYRGIVSRAAWGRDYHQVLKEKLEKLALFIKQNVPEANCIPMVDTGVLADRAVAERAGLGWVGKNANLITPEYGSYVYLGEMITNLPFPPDSPMENGCGACTACLTACPTQAFVKAGQLNAKRCLAYLTQVKGFLPQEVREKMGNRIYGCDTCQQVCPYNRKINFTHQEAFRPDPELARPLLKPLLSIGKREFQEKWGPTAAAWRGKKPIQRNAIIALAHFRDESAVPDLIKLLKEDGRPVIRGTSAWALGKIGGDMARKALEEQRMCEKEEVVLEEILNALRRLEEPVDVKGDRKPVSGTPLQ